ncbi:MAG: DMT family transporter [Phyllobacterium sp.]
MALSPNLRGSLYMALGMASFTINDAVVKQVGEHMNAAQIMFVRGAMATVLVALLAWARNAIIPLSRVHHPMLYLRIAGEVGGTLMFIIALTHVPLALTAAIFQALPLAITIGAALFLNEPVGWRRWVAIFVGFVGVLIIVRPGVTGFSIYSLLILLAVVLAATRDLATRALPSFIPALMISALTSAVITVSGGVMVGPLGGWRPMNATNISLLACAAVFVLIGYQFLIMAVRTGDISFIAPFRYTGLLWAIALGYAIFGDIPDVMMITGSVIVVSSGLYTLYREHQASRLKPATTAIVASTEEARS